MASRREARELLAAIDKSRHAEVQSLCNGLHGVPNEERLEVIESTGSDGRSALMLAAARGHVPTIKLLLAVGANLHAINASRESRGGPLHEAVGHRFEAVTDLLLSHGANPFVSNVAGKSAYELALEVGHTNILRRIEAHALFKGDVVMRVSRTSVMGVTMNGGLDWKNRYVVLARLLPCPVPGTQQQQARTMLWVYKDTTESKERAKLCLDGASASRPSSQGFESTLRLGPSQKPSGELLAAQDGSGCYCVYVKPINVGYTALETLETFLRTLNGACSLPPPVPSTHACPPPGAASAPGTQRLSLPAMLPQHQGSNRISETGAGFVMPVPVSSPPERQQRMGQGSLEYQEDLEGGGAGSGRPSRTSIDAKSDRYSFDSGSRELQPAGTGADTSGGGGRGGGGSRRSSGAGTGVSGSDHLQSQVSDWATSLSQPPSSPAPPGTFMHALVPPQPSTQTSTSSASSYPAILPGLSSLRPSSPQSVAPGAASTQPPNPVPGPSSAPPFAYAARTSPRPSSSGVPSMGMGPLTQDPPRMPTMRHSVGAGQGAGVAPSAAAPGAAGRLASPFAGAAFLAGAPQELWDSAAPLTRGQGAPSTAPVASKAAPPGGLSDAAALWQQAMGSEPLSSLEGSIDHASLGLGPVDVACPPTDTAAASARALVGDSPAAAGGTGSKGGIADATPVVGAQARSSEGSGAGGGVATSAPSTSAGSGQLMRGPINPTDILMTVYGRMAGMTARDLGMSASWDRSPASTIIRSVAAASAAGTAAVSPSPSPRADPEPHPLPHGVGASPRAALLQEQARQQPSQEALTSGSTASASGGGKVAGRVAELPPRADVQFELTLGDGPGQVQVYRAGAILGTGATGVVIRGRYLEQEVAVKLIVSNGDANGTMRAHGGGGPGGHDAALGIDVATMEEQASLEQELAIMARLDHPHVLRVFGGSMRPPTRFIVEELCGMSLSTYIHKRQRPHTLREIVRVAAEVAAGLSYLHQLDIVHRDLKPGNILMGKDNKAKIADFGLARCKYKTYLSTKRLDAGTVAYLCPEALSDEWGGVTTKADMYAFAIILCEMLSHQMPWQGVREVNIIYQVTFEKKRPRLPSCPQRCPEILRTLVEGCWNSDPHKRPDACTALRTLQQCTEVLPPAQLDAPYTPEPSPGPAPGRGPSRGQLTPQLPPPVQPPPAHAPLPPPAFPAHSSNGNGHGVAGMGAAAGVASLHRRPSPPHVHQPQHPHPQHAHPQHAQPQHAQPQHAQPQHPHPPAAAALPPAPPPPPQPQPEARPQQQQPPVHDDQLAQSLEAPPSPNRTAGRPLRLVDGTMARLPSGQRHAAHDAGGGAPISGAAPRGSVSGAPPNAVASLGVLDAPVEEEDPELAMRMALQESLPAPRWESSAGNTELPSASTSARGSASSAHAAPFSMPTAVLYSTSSSMGRGGPGVALAAAAAAVGQGGGGGGGANGPTPLALNHGHQGGTNALLATPLSGLGAPMVGLVPTGPSPRSPPPGMVHAALVPLRGPSPPLPGGGEGATWHAHPPPPLRTSQEGVDSPGAAARALEAASAPSPSQAHLLATAVARSTSGHAPSQPLDRPPSGRFSQTLPSRPGSGGSGLPSPAAVNPHSPGYAQLPSPPTGMRAESPSFQRGRLAGAMVRSGSGQGLHEAPSPSHAASGTPSPRPWGTAAAGGNPSLSATLPRANRSLKRSESGGGGPAVLLATLPRAHQ